MIKTYCITIFSIKKCKGIHQYHQRKGEEVRTSESTRPRKHRSQQNSTRENGAVADWEPKLGSAAKELGWGWTGCTLLTRQHCHRHCPRWARLTAREGSLHQSALAERLQAPYQAFYMTWVIDTALSNLIKGPISSPLYTLEIKVHRWAICPTHHNACLVSHSAYHPALPSS